MNACWQTTLEGSNVFPELFILFALSDTYFFIGRFLFGVWIWFSSFFSILGHFVAPCNINVYIIVAKTKIDFYICTISGLDCVWQIKIERERLASWYEYMNRKAILIYQSHSRTERPPPPPYILLLIVVGTIFQPFSFRSSKMLMMMM